MPERFRTLERDDFDVVAVGAGTGGLTAGALLARRGKRVLVIDQHYEAGGNATVFKRKGYEFDVGLHYIGDCGPNGVIPRILRAAGVTDIEYEEMDPDGYDTLVFTDFRFRIPKGLYLCGASTRTGPGIAGVAMSGLMAASEILGYRLLLEALGRANTAKG